MRCNVCNRPIHQNERTKLDAHGQPIHVVHHEFEQEPSEPLRVPGQS